MLAYIDNHADQAVARVCEQFKYSPKFIAWLRAMVGQLQEIDDATWQLATERLLFTDAELGDVTVSYEAVGEQLDVLGRILDETRGSLTDDQYRMVLKGKVKLLHCSGTAEELIAIFHVLEPDSLITVKTWPPAYVTVTIADPITADKAAIYVPRFMRKAHAAGVAGTLEWQECVDANCLTLSDATAYPETDTLTGLGDATDATAGGYLTGAAG